MTSSSHQTGGVAAPPPPEQLPPVRACLFDMDGLLLNTEDIYTRCADIVLAKYNRPGLPWSLKARMMGVPGSSNGDTFHAWAQLPIPRSQYEQEQREQQRVHFPECAPLPGVERLLSDLRRATTTSTSPSPSPSTSSISSTANANADASANASFKNVQIALATSSGRRNYDMKTSRAATRAVLDLIPEAHKVLGDDPRVPAGRGKPAPDIYLAALRAVNENLAGGADADAPPEMEIRPRECLVFEDSVVGVEAGRRAGMRVVWVPHPGLAAEYAGREEEVLAGRVGLVKGVGHEEQLGAVGDGWGEMLPSLENFPYERYGIIVPS